MSNFFDKLLPTIGALAPTIATGLGGPLAGLAVNALESALGLDAGAAQGKDGQDKITQMIGSLDPQTAAAMRKADQEFQAHLKELDIDVLKINEANVESARTMQIQTRDVTPRVIAAAVVGGLFGLLTIMAFHDLPAANHDALMLLLGSLNAAFGAVIGFYFGSSSGSQNKDATIQLQAAKK